MRFFLPYFSLLFFGFLLIALFWLPFDLCAKKEGLPQSARSKEIIARVAPKLKKELAAQSLQYGAPIFIRIFKSEKQLELWVKKHGQYALFKKYPVCTFSGTLGGKKREGDRQSPEGFYFVKPSQMNPRSSYHLSFNVGYPNKYDRQQGYTGSFLMVHGFCASIGCYAMGNEAIEEIYTLADAALRQEQTFFRIHIFPFKMTQKNLQQYKNSPYHPFWLNLKEGYDLFEKNKRPPNVGVRDKRYIFNHD